MCFAWVILSILSRKLPIEKESNLSQAQARRCRRRCRSRWNSSKESPLLHSFLFSIKPVKRVKWNTKQWNSPPFQSRWRNQPPMPLRTPFRLWPFTMVEIMMMEARKVTTANNRICGRRRSSSICWPLALCCSAPWRCSESRWGFLFELKFGNLSFGANLKFQIIKLWMCGSFKSCWMLVTHSMGYLRGSLNVAHLRELWHTFNVY